MTLCPFCDSPHHRITDLAGSVFWIECGECGATGPRTDDAERAARMWERRPREIVLSMRHAKIADQMRRIVAISQEK